MSTARFIIGDTRDVTATLPDASVDLVLTSPPFLALRSYLPDDHPDKHREIGSEPDPAAFVDMLLALTAEWSRVLTPHGSIAVELGDTYSGSTSGGERTDGGQYGYWPQGGTKHNVDTRPPKGGDGWPLAKSLALVPELYRIGLAYGINPLTGQPSPAGRWRVRNVVRWVRPNPPVGALSDKFRPATSDMVIACRARDRWFDLDAVRTEYKGNQSGAALTFASNKRGDQNGRRSGGTADVDYTDGAGAPPLDWWQITPGGYPGAHYAVFPPELCVKPIEAMCPRHVCNTCGQPRRRIVDVDGLHGKDILAVTADTNDRGVGLHGKRPPMPDITRTTVGWSDCGHDNYRPGLVLDPFAGTGTTLAVATGHGRDAIGIDIDTRNADLAQERIGMFCTIETHTPEKAA